MLGQLHSIYLIRLGTILINEYANTIKNITEHDKAAVSTNGYSYRGKILFYAQFFKKKCNGTMCYALEMYFMNHA